MSSGSSSALRFMPTLLGALSWLCVVAYVALWWVPGFDPAAPSLAVYSSFGAAAAAALSSLAAVVVSTVCLARGAHRTHAILGLVLGLPLTLFFIAGLVIAAIGG